MQILTNVLERHDSSAPEFLRTINSKLDILAGDILFEKPTVYLQEMEKKLIQSKKSTELLTLFDSPDYSVAYRLALLFKVAKDTNFALIKAVN